MTPVSMPLIALSRTIRRMVCQRVTPMFQQATRNASGTACSDSLAATMTTGRVMIATVRLAVRILVPKPKTMTKAPTPNRACTIDRTPMRLIITRLMTLVNQLSAAYSLTYIAAAIPSGTEISKATATNQAVPTSAGNIPPAVIALVDSVNEKSIASIDPPLIINVPKIINTQKYQQPRH